MPGGPNDPNYPIGTTPSVATDPATTAQQDAAERDLFGSATPPTLPANAAGVTGDPTAKLQAAQAAADATMSGSAGGPGLPTNNARAAAAANGNIDTTNPDDPNAVNVDRVPSTLARGRIAEARAPHYFSEQVDNVFLPDFIIYICGANVTQHVKGTLQWSYGLDDTPNTCSFTLDNSNDKFTITPENVIYNHFHAGQSANPYGEFDDSAKAKIWLYKNNELPLPVPPGFFTPNTLPEEDAGGRRLPLSIYGSIFHKMDPIRVWTRVGAYDEWLPAFTGYVMRHTHTDGWVDMAREVQIQASCIRDVMRKMRVQHNSIRYNTPGTTTTTEAYEPQTVGHQFSTPNAENLGGKAGSTSTIDNNSFFQSILRGGDMYAFAWSGMSFKQISEYMTIGGLAPSEVHGDAKAVAARDSQVDYLNSQLQEAIADNENFKLKLQHDQDFVSQWDKTSHTEDEMRAFQSAHWPQILHDDAASVEDSSARITLISNDIGKLKTTAVVQAGAADHVQGIGRMTVGERVYYPATTDLGPAGQKKNADTLDRWHRICSFGSPVRSTKPKLAAGSALRPKSGMDEKPDMSPKNVRYWTLDEIVNPKTGAGSRCRWDDLWAPDNQLVHWLLPSPNGNGGKEGLSGANTTNITDNALNTGVLGVRSWYTRNEMIQEFAKMVDYRWWVTGVGDIVFEFPMYDFEPQDLGPWQDVLTVDYHVISSNLDEEAGDAPTGVRAVGTITGKAYLNTASISEMEPAPNALIYSPNLTSRLGINISVLNYPFINDPVLLKKLAIAGFQKAVLESEHSGIEMGFRPWLQPNRPIKLVPRSRISLTSTVSHSMTIFGPCASSLETGFTRQLDTTGLRRYMTGGAHQPLSFGLIGGAGNLAASQAARVQLQRKEILSLLANGDEASRKAQLDQNVARDTGNASDKFPSGYDVYNVAGFSAFDNTGAISSTAGAQARQAAQDAKSDAFLAKTNASLAALPGAAQMLAGGAIAVTSGMQSADDPPPSDAKTKMAQSGISVGTGSSADPLMATGSSDAKNLKNGLGKVGAFGPADIFNLGSIIASSTRGGTATTAEKTAIGWAVLNGAGAASNLSNLKPNAISGAAAAAHPQWVDSESTSLARSILNGDIADPTGGSTGFAKYDPNVPYNDPRICNALTGTLMAYTPGSTTTVDGQAIQDTGGYVFFKRDTSHEAKVEADKQAKNVHLPSPFDRIEDTTKAAAAKYRIQEAVLCAYMAHETGDAHYGIPGLTTPNSTGDISAGINQVNFEGILINQAHVSGIVPKGGRRLLSGIIRHDAQLRAGEDGTSWDLHYVWCRSDESKYPSVFVMTRTVSAQAAGWGAGIKGGVARMDFFSGKSSEVEAIALVLKDSPDSPASLVDTLTPYNAGLAYDPWTSVVADPKLTAWFAAKALRDWINRFNTDSASTVATNYKYDDMDLKGETIDTYYKAIYSMSNSAQVDTLCELSRQNNVQFADFFSGIPVTSTAKKWINAGPGHAAWVPIVPEGSGMASHSDHSYGVGIGKWVLDRAFKLWPSIKARDGQSLLDQCHTGDTAAISGLEQMYQGGASLQQSLNDLLKKSSGG